MIYQDLYAFVSCGRIIMTHAICFRKGLMLTFDQATEKLKLDLIKKYPEDENRIRKVEDHISGFSG